MIDADKHLISVVGATALGKTALAIALAQHFETEVLSSDSRQFYRDMTVGTAVPSIEELKLVPHHFIQHLPIYEPYSVGKFEADALNKLDQLFGSRKVVVMVGGSGLYIKAVTHGLDHFPIIPSNIRKELRQRFESEGLQPLQELLLSLDPQYHAKADLNNPHRVMRALEISLGTGKPYSSFRRQEPPSREFKTITIGLTAHRPALYQRINSRVDEMMARGLLEEARTLYPHRELNALQTVGYKELFEYLDGTIDLQTAVAEIKKNSRRFAKRQLTWFRKQQDIHWFDYQDDKELIIKAIETLIYEGSNR